MDHLAHKLRLAIDDPCAFNDVYGALAHAVLVFFTRRTFDVEAARDLTAETFAEAFASRKGFRGSTDAEARGWIFAIAHHQFVHYTRRGVARRRAIERLGLCVPELGEDDYDRIVELAGLEQLRGQVAVAFGTLPVKQREALRLRVLDQRGYREVATILGVSEQTARARVSRALRALSGALDPDPLIEAGV